MARTKGSSSSSEHIGRAITAIDAEIQKLTGIRAELARLTTGAGSAKPAGASVRKRAAVKSSAAAPARKKRKVSAATRRKLKEAAKARWAKIRGEI